jgi:hypothetical protein
MRVKHTSKNRPLRQRRARLARRQARVLLAAIRRACGRAPVGLLRQGDGAWGAVVAARDYG